MVHVGVKEIVLLADVYGYMRIYSGRDAHLKIRLSTFNSANDYIGSNHVRTIRNSKSNPSYGSNSNCESCNLGIQIHFPFHKVFFCIIQILWALNYFWTGYSNVKKEYKDKYTSSPCGFHFPKLWAETRGNVKRTPGYPHSLTVIAISNSEVFYSKL